MANEFKLSYTAAEINQRLGKIDNLADKSNIPTKISDLINDDNFATEDYVDNKISAISTQDAGAQISIHNVALDAHNDIRNLISTLDINKLDASELTDAINTALAEAKASGEFDGADGNTPVRGTDYWTDSDKAEIKSYVDEVILGGAW